MNALLHWFAAPEWSQLVKTLLHSLWQGVVIAAVLALVMRRVANPRWRYRLALLALMVIPASAILTWAALNSPNRSLPVPIVQPAPTGTAPAAALGENPQTKLFLLASRSPAPPPSSWTAWLALLWAVGTSAMLGRASVKLAGAERLRRSCQPLDNPQVTQLLAEARRAVGLARTVRVVVTDRLTSPAVVGVLVPTLVLPLTLVTTLTPEQIRFILLHELAHIRRGDYLANLFQFFIEAVLFFNPAVWWISHQVRREREACCDALAIQLSGAPADYARTLVHVAESMLNSAPSAATAFGNESESSSLADRVRRLLVPGYRPSLRLTWRAMIAAFVVGSFLLILCAEGTRVAVAQIAKPPTKTVDPKKTPTAESEPPVGEPIQPSGETTDAVGNTHTNSAKAVPQQTLQISGVGAGSRVLYDQNTGKSWVTNRGLVRLPGLAVEADSIELDHNMGKLIASGNVRVERPGFTNDTSRIELSIYSNQPLAPLPKGQMIFTSEKRHAILNKLNEIKLERIEFDGMPLSNVVRSLAEEVKQHDPERRGVNIIINPTAPPADDGHAMDVGSTKISLKPPLKNVRLMDALNAILKCADKPLKLSIEEYAVVISLKGQEPTPLFMREFNLDSAIFLKQLANVGSLLDDPTSATNANALATSVRSFFSQMGVDLDPMQGKSVFYSDKRGILLVRATKEELDHVERAIMELNRQEPQINITVRFVETENLRDLSSFSHNMAGQTNGLPVALSQLKGILTESQYQTVVAAIDQPKGFSILLENEMTTGNGRQAQMQTVEIKTIVTDINPKALVSPGIITKGKDDENEALFTTTKMSFGPTVDIIPTIAPDGRSIALTVISRLTEFLGYEGMTDPTNQVVTYQDGKKVKAFLPRPLFRAQVMTNQAVVPDGMTLVLGGAPIERTRLYKDRVPFLGDIPWVGKLFRNETTQVKTNFPLIFVTPKIVNTATERIRPSTAANKDGSDESFHTSTNLRPIIDVPIY